MSDKSKASITKSDKEKSIFATIMIAATRLQTLFDKTIPQLTLKQFMLLEILRLTHKELTLHEIGERLGCSRQNVRQLAESLVSKGLVTLDPSSRVRRALCVRLTDKVQETFASKLQSYIDDLHFLFEVYTDEELQTLYQLLGRLYTGIDNLERKAPELQEVRADTPVLT